MTTAPHTFAWRGVAPGTCPIKAKPFNVQGTMDVSQPITVVVPSATG